MLLFQATKKKDKVNISCIERGRILLMNDISEIDPHHLPKTI